MSSIATTVTVSISPDDLMEKYREQEYMYNGRDVRLGNLPLHIQFAIVTEMRYKLTKLNQDFNKNMAIINKEFEHNIQDGMLERDAVERKARDLTELDTELKDAKLEGQLVFDMEPLAIIHTKLAELTAVSHEINENELNENNGFRVKFNNCPLPDLSNENRDFALNTLQDRYGPIHAYNIVLVQSKAELYVSYVSLDSKKRCLEAGNIAELGTPVSPLSSAYIANAESKYSIYIDRLRTNTNEEMIRAPYILANVEPNSVKILGGQAFVNFDTLEELHRALRLRRVNINGRTHFPIAAKHCDPDDLKGILGFWSGNTTHLNKLYANLHAHDWDFLYVQPTTWANGALKHYYFIKFSTQLDMELAMLSPLRIGADVLRIFPVERDEAGRLVFPVEGEWRKRARVAPMDTDAQDTNTQTPQRTQLRVREFAIDI